MIKIIVAVALFLLGTTFCGRMIEHFTNCIEAWKAYKKYYVRFNIQDFNEAFLITALLIADALIAVSCFYAICYLIFI